MLDTMDDPLSYGLVIECSFLGWQFTSSKLRIPSAQDSIRAPDNKVHGVTMGPIWGRQDQVGPHVAPQELYYLGLFLSSLTVDHSGQAV